MALMAITLAMVAWLGPVHAAQADARSDYLIRLLQSSSQFRVRVQAAISLGTVTGASQVVRALTTALGDEHPAVRAAAANSLGRLGDPSAISSLRAVENDAEPPVRVAAKAAIAKLEVAARRRGDAIRQEGPRGPPRFYVAMGRTASKVPEMSASELEAARRELRDRVGQMDGVVLAPEGENSADARKVLSRRKLRGYYLETSVTSVEDKPGGGTRVAVSVIVATYPGRDMRAILSGAATAMGGGDARRQATAAAFKSALRKLPQAMGRD
jgi:hypothetical protein